jgi:hypothetical protein
MYEYINDQMLWLVVRLLHIWQLEQGQHAWYIIAPAKFDCSILKLPVMLANACATELMWLTFDWSHSFGLVQGDISVWKLDNALSMENCELGGGWTRGDWILQHWGSVSAQLYSVATLTAGYDWEVWWGNVSKWLCSYPVRSLTFWGQAKGNNSKLACLGI